MFEVTFPLRRIKFMPIYEFKCPDCNKLEEKIQKISDPNPSCPTCQKTMEKLISSSAFELKGTGWYVTDYKKSSNSGSSNSGSSQS
jgi:putative FmdB family regulatory protein